MANITYVGGNVIDWNTEIDKSELSRIANIIKESSGRETHFQLNANEIWEIKSGDSSTYLYLNADQKYAFDKNPEKKDSAGKDSWLLKTSLNPGEKVTRQFNGLRRPGGGPTNNEHVAGTLARSMGSNTGLDLLVLEESRFVEDILKSELSGASIGYDAIRKFKKEMDNINFRINGKKITYTSIESAFQPSEIPDLEVILNKKCKQIDDVLVVNSVKDKEYLSAILNWYDNSDKKPVLIAAVTNSMIGKIKDGLDVHGLVKKSDIYISNIEELYELLKTKTLSHRGSSKELTNADLYESMLYILKQQKTEGKKGRVYVTCGDNGSVVMDSHENLYFQRISSMIEGPTQKEPLVDLNGAGDTFAGVISLLEADGRHSVLEIFDYANAAAQICVRHPGANGNNRITKEEISKFRKYHTQDIWKYDTRTREFDRYCSIKCNIK